MTAANDDGGQKRNWHADQQRLPCALDASFVEHVSGRFHNRPVNQVQAVAHDPSPSHRLENHAIGNGKIPSMQKRYKKREEKTHVVAFGPGDDTPYGN
jgi:hypothetical protein